ncbi:MAG: GNAT family N-acetyltransferase [Clostridiaceae bacterium]|nr:GNAT family N-acetyltransferase [Clostridiaceae bacterium]
MSILFRKAGISDAKGIAYVHYKAWIEAYTGLIHEDYLAARSQEKSMGIFERSGCKNIIVACSDEGIIGFCIYDKARDSDLPPSFGEIQAIYVLEKYQRMGVGHGLLQSAFEELEAEGYLSVCLWVLKANKKGIGFYEKNGFHFDGREKEDVLVTPVIELRYIRNIVA